MNISKCRLLLSFTCSLLLLPVCAMGFQANQFEQANTLITPTIPQIQMVPRVSIPATFKVSGVGLELVSIDQGKAVNVLYQNTPSVLDPGDIISQLGTTRLSSEYLIGLASEQLGGQAKIPMQIVNVKTGEAEQVILVSEVCSVPVPRYIEKPTVGAKVYVVHIVDTDDPRIGNFASSNISPMLSLVQEGIDKNRRASYSLLCGKKVQQQWKDKGLRLRNCSAGDIVTELHELPITNQDSLFVYYQGHGAYDTRYEQNDISFGHYLNLGGKDLLRSELVKSIAAKNAAMSVLITDCCNTTVSEEPTFFVQEVAVPITGWSCLESLLLCHTGFVDITASSRGESAWYVSGMGGVFTNSFINAAGTHTIREWPEFLTKLSNDTSDSFSNLRAYVKKNPAGVEENAKESLKNQESMRPRFYRTDIRKNLPSEPAPKPRQLRRVRQKALFSDV